MTWSSLRQFLAARLSHRIAFWVFFCIVVIELMILVPSVHRRESELLRQLEQVGRASLAPMVVLSHNQQDFANIFAASHKFLDDFPVIGGALYHQDGMLLSEFGEMPRLQIAEVQAQLQQQTVFRYQYEHFYEVAWSLQPRNDQEAMFYQNLVQKLQGCAKDDCPTMQKIVLLLRFDAQAVKTEIIDFIIRIAGLVLLICLFVTTGMLLVLGPLVVNPILHLRRALTCFGLSHQKPNPTPPAPLEVKRRDELGDVMLAFNQMNLQITQQIQQIKQREQQLKNVVGELEAANQQAEHLLLNILPRPIAQQLKAGVSPIADYYPQATVLFADLVGFTPLSSRIPPTEMVELLNQLFTAFDHLAEQHQLEKIKTIGDAYMIVGGVPLERADHVEAIANMALDMRAYLQNVTHFNGHSLAIRIGIHTGPVVAGVIGVKKFIYDLWGDTVNIASRMESHGVAGAIHVSAATYECLKARYQLSPRGTIDVKGKGEMATYLLEQRLGVVAELVE